jgi:hypothetical protein
LHGGREERLMIVLTVQIDEVRADLRELTDRREASIDVGP